MLKCELVEVFLENWNQFAVGLINCLDTKDYYEIGKMCMKPEMPKNSESQMLSGVINWMKKHCPEKKFLYTWADGIMGKPGYVYQAANFLYGGFIWTQIYISDKGEKIHPRSSKRLCLENYEFDEILSVCVSNLLGLRSKSASISSLHWLSDGSQNPN